MSFFEKLFGGPVDPDKFVGDIRTLHRYFKTSYENADELGLCRITIMYNVFEYGAGTGSLEGHTGMGGFLAVAGIGGNNDGLAQELGAKVSTIKGKKYYQFIHKCKFSKKEKVAILSKLCSDISQEYTNLNIYFDEKIPAISVGL